MFIKVLEFITISWLIQEIIGPISCEGGLSAVDIDQIRNQCSKKLNFESINEFQIFMSQFERYDWSDNQKTDDPLTLCLESKEALLDLRDLIENYDKRRACKFSEIDKLENYARKYFINKKRPLSLKFFTLFGVNLGIQCKLNLLAHLSQAETEVDQLDFIYSMASPTGWNVLINEYTKKNMKFGGSSNSGNSVVNQIAKLVPGLVGIEQLDYIWFRQSDDKQTTTDKELSPVENESFRVGDEETANKLAEYLEKIIQSCKNLDQFYLNSVLSLARLNELNLLVNVETIDQLHENSFMLHKWLAAASFCQIIARVEVDKDIKQANLLNLKIIHDDTRLDSRRTLYSYVTELDEITDEAKANAWSASVPDGRWVRKYEAKTDQKSSKPMKRLLQFLKGLERDYLGWKETETKDDS